VCGRFTLTYPDRERLAAELGVPVDQLPESEYRPRYNIAPTDRHWILRQRREDRQLLPARWGLINTWSRDRGQAARQINARCESIDRLRPFRDAFRRRRCVVPADGFFEWVGSKEARRPFWLHRPDGGLLLFAGVYESWQPAPGEWERTFTIITSPPNSVVGRIHDRMPVILLDAAVEEWLYEGQTDVDALKRLLLPAPEELLAVTAVSARVNSVKNDDPSCLEPAPDQVLL